MCLIVFKEDTHSIFTNRQFKAMIARNADGLGIMWREDGRVKVEKVVGNANKQFELFRRHRGKAQYAMHSRMKTHGLINLDNCHPYKIMNMDDGDPIDLYLMHNGVIQGAPSVDNNMSDTWHLCEYVLKPIIKNNLELFWSDENFQHWFQKTITGSKLLLMRSDDVKYPTLILNAGAGAEQTGCWLSNTYSTRTHGPAKTFNYAGGTQSVKTPFTMTSTGQTATTTSPTVNSNAEMPWEDYLETRRAKFDDQTFTKQEGSKIFLPDYSKPDKIIELHANGSKVMENDPDEPLYSTLKNLHGLSAYAIKEWVRDDPDLTADLILIFYTKNTMPYELILDEIKDKHGIDGIVDIIRHLASTIYAPTIRNVS